MSEVNAEYVKRGFWVNLSRGPILGPTITTDTKTGAIVVALLAIFTSLAMSHLWSLINFVWYQIRADGRPVDGLFRQQQALFRTMPSPSSSMTDSIKLFFAWKGRLRSPALLAHSLILALVALFFASATLAAGVFSSYTVEGSNIEVLVSSPFCGRANPPQINERYYTIQHAASQQYADECYRQGKVTPSRCNVFIRPTIPIHVRTDNISCPFSREMCKSSTVAYDTGLLDLNEAFGFNLEREDRVRFRRTSTCAILSQEGRTLVVNDSDIPDYLRGSNDKPFLG